MLLVSACLWVYGFINCQLAADKKLSFDHAQDGESAHVRGVTLPGMIRMN